MVSRILTAVAGRTVPVRPARSGFLRGGAAEHPCDVQNN